MDAGGVGALIGVSVMVGGCIFCYVYELYKKQIERKNSLEKVIEKISVVVQNPTPVSLVRNSSHKKLSEILPSSRALSFFLSIQEFALVQSDTDYSSHHMYCLRDYDSFYIHRKRAYCFFYFIHINFSRL